jgi:hypothetical protein
MPVPGGFRRPQGRFVTPIGRVPGPSDAIRDAIGAPDGVGSDFSARKHERSRVGQVREGARPGRGQGGFPPDSTNIREVFRPKARIFALSYIRTARHKDGEEAVARSHRRWGKWL